jgi:IclR family transcriptional regulator, KDG regulon repressor
VPKEKTDYMIQTVAHALDLLELYHDESTDLSLGEAASRLGMSKDNTQRLLLNLQKRDYLELDKLTDRYRLGFKSFELGQTYLHQGGLLQRGQATLQEIALETHETAYLAVLQKRQVAYIAAVESDQTVRVVSRLGTRLPAYCTASGKAHLADLDDRQLDKLYPDEAFKVYTQTTHADKASLRRELQRITEQGYAIDDEELDCEVRCVAVPVRDYSGGVIAALSVSGPSFRMTHEHVEQSVAPLLVQAAAELSRKLGA